MCSSPACRSLSARGRVSPTPEVTSVVYRRSEWACAASSSTSDRASGSPPERPSCRTPNARASVNTRFQSSVVSSSFVRFISSGFEQYGQRRGHRWVISASSVVGWLLDTNELSIGELRQILEHVARHIPMIPLSKDRRDVPHRASPVAEIQDCRARRVKQDDAFGIEKN